MRKSRVAIILAASCFAANTAFAYGFLGHIAAYTAAGVAAHETERYLDHRSERNHSGQAEAEGGDTFPISKALPNPNITPGRISTAVTQDNLDETVCRKGGYTRSVRPPEDYTEKIKREQIREYGFEGHRLGEFELDHLVALTLGGAPASPQNLWPQPHNVEGGWGSYAKDKLELVLHKLVCSRQVSLAQAQHDMATNWIEAYKKYIGQNPDNQRQHYRGD